MKKLALLCLLLLINIDYSLALRPTANLSDERVLTSTDRSGFSFESVPARDAFFGVGSNSVVLKTGIPVVVNQGRAVTTFIWTGADNPVSYDPDLFKEQALNSGPGTLFLGIDGANLSSAAKVINFNSAYGDKALGIGNFFGPKGSVRPFVFDFEKESVFTITDVFDTQLSQPQEFFFSGPLGSTYTEGLLIRPATVGTLTLKGYAGSSDTDPIALDATFQVSVGDIGNIISIPFPNGLLSTEVDVQFVVLDGIDLFGGLQTSGDFSGQTKPFLQATIHVLQANALLNTKDLDQYIGLNRGHITATVKSGGIIVGTLPTATTDTFTNATFIAGIDTTSNPTVQTDGSNTFSPNDIVLLRHGANFLDVDINDGFYEVASHVGATLIVKGIGTIPVTEDALKDQFTFIESTGTITKVGVSILKFTDSELQQGFGNTTPISFGTLGSGWTDDGTTVRLTTSTDAVVIGADTGSGAALEVIGQGGASVGGFASGHFQVKGSGILANSNAVITGHNSFGGNKQLWYLGSASSSNDDITIINRQNDDLSFGTNNITRLTVSNTGTFSTPGDLDLTTGTGGVFKFVDNAFQAGLDSSNYLETGHGGSNSFVNSVGAGNMDFRFNGTNKATFTSFGHLHLLTDVDQKHNLKIKTANNANDSGIAWENSGGNFSQTIFRTDVGGNNSDLIFAIGSNANIDLLTESIRIHGAVSELAKVEIVGDLQITSGGPVVGDVLTAIDTDGNTNWSLPSGGGWTDAGTFLILTNINDNVGLGTSSPGNQKLAVRGTSPSATGDGSELIEFRDDRTTTTSAPNYLLAINRQNSTTAAWYFGNDGDANAILASNNRDIRIGKDLTGTFTENMRVKVNGDIVFNKYLNTRDDGTPVNILSTDASGNLISSPNEAVTLNQDALGVTAGSINYDLVKGTMNVRNIFTGSSIQVGQENVVFVVNKTGVTIPDGKVVDIGGYDDPNDAMEIQLALADKVKDTAVLGITTTTMIDGAVGLVTVFGRVNDLDTTSFTGGDVVYLSSTIAGDITATRPAIPIQIGHVGKIDASVGFIQVQIRELQKSIFGGYVHRADQTFTANVSKAISFDTNKEFSGITHSETVDNSEFTFPSPGVYQATAEPQYTRTTGGGTDVLNIFVAKDTGSGFNNEADSNVKFSVNTAGNTTVSPLTATFRVASGDKIRFMAQVESANLILDAFPASGTTPNDIPLTPSIIMNITRIGD